MSNLNLSSGEISALIDHVLKSKDPAAVGIRKILKDQKSKENAYPLHRAPQEEFYTPETSKNALSEQERVVLDLQQQVNRLRAQAEQLQREITRRERAAYEKGVEEGTATGTNAQRDLMTAQHAAAINEMQKRLNGFFGAVEQSKNSMYVNAHGLLLSLCFEIAEKIICAETSCNPRVVASVLKSALGYIADKDRLVIRVAKDDVETVSGRKDFWMPVGENLSSLTIEPDQRIERGGCIIESNSGMVDARLGVQLGQMRELVESLWKSMSASALPSDGGQTGGGA